MLHDDEEEALCESASAHILGPSKVSWSFVNNEGWVCSELETGLRTWPVSHFMVEMLARHPCMIPDGPVLELGSGIGMLGCLLRRLLPRDDPVVLTDIQTEECPEVMNYLRANVRLNADAKPLVVEELFWGSTHIDAFKTRLRENHQLNIDSLGGFKCIIGCDLVYGAPVRDLLDTINLLLAKEPLAVVYLTYQDRGDSAFLEKLDAVCLELGFVVKDLPLVNLCNSWEDSLPNSCVLPPQRLRRREIWLNLVVQQLGIHLLSLQRSNRA